MVTAKKVIWPLVSLCRPHPPGLRHSEGSRHGDDPATGGPRLGTGRFRRGKRRLPQRLPRRMLSAWVPQRRPTGAPTMTYGRSIFKALEKFNIDVARWPELAANRAAWRETLRTGLASPE